MGSPVVRFAWRANIHEDEPASRSLGLGANVTFAIAGAAGIALITVLAVNAT